MAELNDFTITLYDKTLRKLRTVGAWKSFSPTVRHNQQSTASLTLSVTPDTASVLADLLADGTRVVATYKGEFLMSGATTGDATRGPARESDFTFQVEDDYAVLTRMLAAPVANLAPTSGTSATYATAYDTRTGPAETVLKGIVNANKGRMNVPGVPPLFVAPDLGRGRTITVQSRFDGANDKLMPLVDAAGIGITVRQLPDGNGGQRLVLDVYEQRTHPRTISEASGALQGYALTRQAPQATAVWVGGKGDLVDRIWTYVHDAALSARIGYVIEGKLDATDTDTEAQRRARGDAYLAENAGTSGISVELLATPSLTFTPSLSPSAPGIRVGDLLPVRLGTVLDPNTGAEVGVGVNVTDVLRSVSLSSTADGGSTVNPQVGDVSDSTDPADNIIRRLWSQVSQLRSR